MNPAYHFLEMLLNSAPHGSALERKFSANLFEAQPEKARHVPKKKRHLPRARCGPRA
jgi:hypothetical protein